MKKLRLLITKACNKSCEGCCNKDWKLDELPSINLDNLHEIAYFDEILITGGEPTIDKIRLLHVLNRLNRASLRPKIYLYTNGFNAPLIASLLALGLIDGVTLTLHDNSLSSFIELTNLLVDLNVDFDKLSLRLNVFKEATNFDLISTMITHKWKIKRDMVWIENCPLPIDEIFMKYI